MSAFVKSAPVCHSDRDGLAVLGSTRHALMGIRYSDGAGGAAPAAAPAGQQAAAAAAAAAAPPAPGTATPPAATPPAATPPAATPPAVDAPVGGVPFDQLPAETQAEVRRLRQSDLAWRTERSTLQAQLEAGMTAEQRKELGKLLGYEKDEAPDATALTQQVTQVSGERDTLKDALSASERVNMVLRTAPDANANADLLLDSKGFADKIKGLDPTDRAAFKTAIESWVAENPTYAVTIQPGLPRTSTPRATGNSTTPSKPGLEGAIAKQMGTQAP